MSDKHRAVIGLLYLGDNMCNFNEACKELLKAIEGQEIDLNFSSDRGVQIHWHGVIQLDCTPEQAAKAIPLLMELNALGARDC